jgi:prophage maintenance system killer protein
MIHYLTVQDVLWINQEVTKRVNDFKFAQLEEATYAQYAYGKSKGVLTQAAQFLATFLKLKPFTSGNRATAFVAALTFLKMNGYELALPPEKAQQWVDDVLEKRKEPIQAIQEIAMAGAPVHLKPVVRTIVHDLIEEYEEAVQALSDS